MAVQLERSQVRFAPGPHIEAFSVEGRELVTNSRLTITPTFAEVDISGRIKILRKRKGEINFGLLKHLAEHVTESVSLADLTGVAIAAGSTDNNRPRYRISQHIIGLRGFFEDDWENPRIITATRLDGETYYSLNLPPEAVSFAEMAKYAVDPKISQLFAHEYETNQKTVVRYLRFKVGSPSLAEELAAETFAKAWEGIGGYEHKGIPLSHWLLRIARNVVIDHIRRSSRWEDPIDEGFYERPSHELPPDEVAERNVEVEKLRRALSRLPADQRDVLILRFIEGYSHEDTAAVLGRSVVAVRQIQVRGLRTIRKLLMSKEESQKKLPPKLLLE